MSTVLRSWFSLPPELKAERIDSVLNEMLRARTFGVIEDSVSRLEEPPGRDGFVILPIPQHPPKPGLSQTEGLLRLLHDVANIELQAMELAVLTLGQFPDAPNDFKLELAAIASDEARHFRLCSTALRDAGRPFGSWPIHISLWRAALPDQSLLDRIMTVHRYLEGSGLDSGESILNRLRGSPNREIPARAILQVIVREEIPHVLFGSRWFHELCRLEGRDPSVEFRSRLTELRKRAPRHEALALGLRRQAGFTDGELHELESLKRQSTQPSETLTLT